MAGHHLITERTDGSLRPKQKQKKEKLPPVTILAAYFPDHSNGKVMDVESSELAVVSEPSSPRELSSPSSVLDSGPAGITIGPWSLGTTTRISYSDKLMGRHPHKHTSFADKVRASLETDKAKDKGAVKTTKSAEKACQTEPEVVWFKGMRFIKYDEGDSGYSSS